MAAVSKTAKPSAPVVVGRLRSTKTGILPFGFRVLMNHGSFCLPVRREMCSTLVVEVLQSVAHSRTGSDSLVCDLVAVDALQLLEVNRDFPPIWGTFGVKDERGFGSSGHVSVD